MSLSEALLSLDLLLYQILKRPPKIKSRLPLYYMWQPQAELMKGPARRLMISHGI